MNNRKRANGITGGIISIILGIIIFVITFPSIFLGGALIVTATGGLYLLFKLIRNIVEDYLDEEDINEKWKQDKNIK
jgi:hypothetical protein